MCASSWTSAIDCIDGRFEQTRQVNGCKGTGVEQTSAKEPTLIDRPGSTLELHKSSVDPIRLHIPTYFQLHRQYHISPIGIVMQTRRLQA